MDWEKDWDAEVGLWWGNGPGHTQATKHLDRLHSGVTAATQLVSACNEGILPRVEAGRVLAALRDMQHADEGDLYGCMRWYWEEQRPQDTNAAWWRPARKFRKCAMERYGGSFFWFIRSGRSA